MAKLSQTEVNTVMGNLNNYLNAVSTGKDYSSGQYYTLAGYKSAVNDLQQYVSALKQYTNPEVVALAENATAAITKANSGYVPPLVEQPTTTAKPATTTATTTTPAKTATTTTAAKTSTALPSSVTYLNPSTKQNVTVARPSGTSDADWQKLMDGYTARFGNPTSTVAGTATTTSTPAATTSTATTSGTTGTASAAGTAALIKKVLAETNTKDLTNYTWWVNDPNKTAAYAQLQDIFSTPQKLADYVKTNGITNLQNTSWWSNYAQKDQAWQLISGSAATSTGTTGTASNTGTSNTGTSNTGTSNTGTNTGTASGTTGTTGTTNTTTTTDPAADIINNSDLLSPDIKALYNLIAANWSKGTQIDQQSLTDAFNQVKTSTIDPYFQQLAAEATDQIQTAYSNAQTNRALELQGETANSDQNIKTEQGNLESAGLTFSGEAGRQLGQSSAFGGKGLMGTFTDAQGLVPTQNSLVASKSAAAYQQSLQSLQRTAEESLGTTASTGLVPGITPLGNITGSIADTKAQTEYSRYQDLTTAAQERAAEAAPISPIA